MTAGSQQILDIVGVGFGPSNLALAIALEEYNECHSGNVTAEFIEAKPEFGWHTGMLIPDATMQISFLKDLVTQRNPQSSFTFLNYLTERNRLSEFINFKTFFPTRIEFHDYLAWAANKVAATVRYGSRVTAIRDTDGIFTLEVCGKHSGQLRARNIVIANGLRCQLPPGVTPTVRQIHNHDFLNKLKELPPNRHHRFVVVGAGQSAAEVTAYLHALSPSVEVHSVFAKYGYTPADDSPFANRIFDASAVDDFYMADSGIRRALLNYHRSTNYSAVDLTLIEDLYAREYSERVGGNRRLFLRGVSSIYHTEESVDGVRVYIQHHPTGVIDEIDCDAIIYATGFAPAPISEIMGDFYRHVLLEDGQPVILRDYRLATAPPTVGGIYLQGNTEHTHGLTSSLLSNVAIRSGEILQSIMHSNDNERLEYVNAS